MSVCYRVTPITFEGTVSIEHTSRQNVCGKMIQHDIIAKSINAQPSFFVTWRSLITRTILQCVFSRAYMSRVSKCKVTTFFSNGERFCVFLQSDCAVVPDCKSKMDNWMNG